MNAFGYWGKTHEGGFHRLPYHSLDVAACAVRLIERSDRLANSLLRHLPITREELTGLIGWAAALHDIGKLSPTFQHLDVTTSTIASALGVAKIKRKYDVRHDSLGWELWREISGPMFPDARQVDAADVLMRCATGHHGKPPSNLGNGTRISVTRYFTPVDVDAGREWIQWTSDYFKPTFPRSSALEEASWWIAGLITLADWLGSNMDWFPYREDIIEPDEYFQSALTRADKAITEADVVADVVKRTYFEMFPSYQPTPVQQAVLDLPTDGNSFLLVIEETTGGGKTEAALAAAAGSAFFFGLPTMATANGIWRRTRELGGQQALIHSKKWFMPDAMDRASAWLNHSGRQALLADIGVGTVDQAMIAVMYARYATLRLVGLAGKTLIIDEVHAYDAYMKRILEVLVEMQAKSGGSVILLSATMPLSHRRDYAAAWCRGRNLSAPSFTKDAFPLVTHVDSSGHAIERGDLKSQYQDNGGDGRHVRIEHASTFDVVVARIMDESKSGQSVAWIRNTVREAVEAYDILKAANADVELFHSRFTVRDRLAIENRVIETFGKESTGESRKGKILVATQVIEQSLDLDFDFMVTDLCPVDLLIQRAGRLHRHERGDRGVPTLLLHAPSWTDSPGSGWVTDWSMGTSFVYPDHGRLWLTMELAADGFVLPKDARMLVEGIYGLQIPIGLSKQSLKTEGMDVARVFQGDMSAIKPGMPYQAGVPTWDDVVAPTRLGEPTAEWIICEDGAPVNGAIAESTLQLRESQLFPFEGEAKIPGQGPWQRVLSLTAGSTSGQSRKGPVQVTYDQKKGLSIS
ncbi:MAG: CRISPR-associated helicase Cas3' [Proteobacteria bacterium]|nr:CRISPR-associated helicase Cas3' [Pseudomonadota bacterium]